MDILQLPMREMRKVYWKLKGLVNDHPDFDGVEAIRRAIKQHLKSQPDYQKGMAMLRDAEKNGGIDSGYARAEDYYFAVKAETIERAHQPPLKHAALLLCFKWNWWMNGQSYCHPSDGQESRNFSDFLPQRIRKQFSETGDYGGDAVALRSALLAAGLEEKPELIPFYDACCKLSTWDARNARLDAEAAEDAFE